MSLVDTLLDIGQTAHMQWRVWQHSVHPREAVHREETVEDAHHEQIEVIGTALLQSRGMR